MFRRVLCDFSYCCRVVVVRIQSNELNWCSSISSSPSLHLSPSRCGLLLSRAPGVVVWWCVIGAALWKTCVVIFGVQKEIKSTTLRPPTSIPPTLQLNVKQRNATLSTRPRSQHSCCRCCYHCTRHTRARRQAINNGFQSHCTGEHTHTHTQTHVYCIRNVATRTACARFRSSRTQKSNAFVLVCVWR